MHYNDECCIKNDEFCIKNDEIYTVFFHGCSISLCFHSVFPFVLQVRVTAPDGKTVRFLSENLDFLLKNLHFLIKNRHFYIKTGLAVHAAARQRWPRCKTMNFVLNTRNFVQKRGILCPKMMNRARCVDVVFFFVVFVLKMVFALKRTDFVLKMMDFARNVKARQTQQMRIIGRDSVRKNDEFCIKQRETLYQKRGTLYQKREIVYQKRGIAVSKTRNCCI